MQKMGKKKPKLLVFFGMIAAGKSFLANYYARRTDSPYFNTDVVRKELAGIALQSRIDTDFKKGIYSPEFNRLTYDELIRRTAEALHHFRAQLIILDGSYNNEGERRRVVAACGSDLAIYFIYCYCSELTVRSRLEKRAQDAAAVSDGRLDIYLQQKKSFDVARPIEGAHLLLLNTEKTVDVLFQVVERFIESPEHAGGS